MLLYGAVSIVQIDLWSPDWLGASEDTVLRSDGRIDGEAAQIQLLSCINFRPCIALS